MIIGIGTDIVQIPRIEKLIDKFGNYFAQKILAEIELEKYESLVAVHKASFLAKRFAAKESIAKAFGKGIGASIRFHDIIIDNDSEGKPLATLNFSLAQGKKLFLSISDDYPVAVAFAVISM